MKKTLISAFFVTLSSVSQSARIQNEVDKLINQINPNVNLGAVVVDLTSGETLYRRNAGRLYIPASNMKLFPKPQR